MLEATNMKQAAGEQAEDGKTTIEAKLPHKMGAVRGRSGIRTSANGAGGVSRWVGSHVAVSLSHSSTLSAFPNSSGVIALFRTIINNHQSALPPLYSTNQSLIALLLFRLGDRRRLLHADSTLCGLRGLRGLGGGLGAGGGGLGGLALGLLGAEDALQARGLVGGAAVLLLLELGEAAGLGVDICELLLTLGV